VFLCEQSHSLRINQPDFFSEPTILPVITKRQSNIRIFYFTLDIEIIESKTKGEQAADDCQPISQGKHFSI